MEQNHGPSDVVAQKLCSSCVRRYDIDDFVRNNKTNKTCNKCGAKKRRHDQKKRGGTSTSPANGPTPNEAINSDRQPFIQFTALIDSTEAQQPPVAVSSSKRKRSLDSIASTNPVSQRQCTSEQGYNDALPGSPVRAVAICSDTDSTRSANTTPDLVSDGGSRGSESPDCTSDNVALRDPPTVTLSAEPMFVSKVPDAHSLLPAIVEDEPFEPRTNTNEPHKPDRTLHDSIDALSVDMRRLSHHSSLNSSKAPTFTSSKVSSNSSRRSFMSNWSAPMPAPMGTDLDDEMIRARARPEDVRKVARWKVGPLLMYSKSKLRQEMFMCAVTGDVAKLRDILALGECGVNDPMSKAMSASYPKVQSLLELAIHSSKPTIVRFLIKDCVLDPEALCRGTDLAARGLAACAIYGRVEYLEAILQMDLVDTNAELIRVPEARVSLADPLPWARYTVYNEAIAHCRERVVEILLEHQQPDWLTEESAHQTLLIALNEQARFGDRDRFDTLLRISALMRFERPVFPEMISAITGGQENLLKNLLEVAEFDLLDTARAICHAVEVGQRGPVLGRLLLALPLKMPGFSAKQFLRYEKHQQSLHVVCYPSSMALSRRTAGYFQLAEWQCPPGPVIDSAREALAPSLTPIRTPGLLTKLYDEAIRLDLDEVAECLHMALFRFDHSPEAVYEPMYIATSHKEPLAKQAQAS
ncbi:hypothetical protein B0A48_01313 [Cryoendolithus antarcticus]|uniref:Uncharacterized protein n=1 Tax=Cryoendolithus antarcticus TaxID=1507870 RepID=A0A1V8TSU8_9PEZI|nr:hypothetical protein B0A48_01313 [Cryoendolithus antarcticus]